MVDSEREAMRLKLTSMPGIASGIISASKSASFDESVAIQLKLNDCGLCEFFGAAETEHAILAAAQKREIKQTCLDAFTCEENNEDALRNDIFKELKGNAGISFPDGSDDNNCGQYSEMELKAHFVQFGKKLNEELSINDKEQGMLVTTRSKPNLCVSRELPDGNTEVKFGEVKHCKAYTKKSASRQALLYLHSLLYFFRVKLGIPVDTVYGFVICGPKCKDLKSDGYAVGLLKLTAPQGLGDEFEGRQYTTAYKTNDSTGLQLLVHFLTEGNVSNVSTAFQYRREKEKRGPCLFAVPRSLWKDTEGPDGRELVIGGTCAMVFRVSFNKLGELLEEVTRSREDVFWALYLSQEGEKWKDCAGKVYVKIRTKDTTAHFQEDFFCLRYRILQDQKRESERTRVDGGDTDFLVSVGDFFETYIVAPYGSSSFCLCVMADRGVPFDPETVVRNELKMLLGDLKVKIMGMAKVIFHGDALLHNIVYNESTKSLHLIDFDEGTRVGKKVPRRSLNFTSGFPWFEALLYPNALRQAAESYTRVQFTASVLLMLVHHDSGAGNEGNKTLDKLTEVAEKLGKLLAAEDGLGRNWQDEEVVPEEVQSLIKEADGLLDALLRTEDSDSI